jgi:FkbM family methyltransferase
MMNRLQSTDPMDDFLCEHLSAGQCAFDIGANSGRYTLPMLDLVGPHGTVHAFEPNPQVAEKLAAAWNERCLADYDSDRQLQVHECALSDSADPSREFFVDAREELGMVASSFHRLTDLHSKNLVRPIRVMTSTVDAFQRASGAAQSLIKIDVEGHELSVLRGASETISRFRPVIVFEFWETWWDKGIRKIFDYLRHHYDMSRIQDGDDVHRYYYENHGEGVVDIGCVPSPERRNDVIDPTLLT